MMAPAHDAELRRLLETRLGANGKPASVEHIETRPFDRATSYPFELLRVRLDGGRHRDVVVKDFGTSLLPKDDRAARAEREIAVYRDLLDGAGLGTAELYGIAHRPPRLLLEHVEGTELRYLGLESWMETAAWLGRFQARMAGRAERVARSRVLLRHDPAFFLGRARAARGAIPACGPDAARRLDAILDGYERLVEMMVDQPRTLVHGSFRPQNIIVTGPTDAPSRICPVDWELAGFGSSLYDLAFLADGFRGSELDGIVEAYLRGRGRAQSSAGSEMARVIDCFRLHKITKSIGDSVALAFRPPSIERLLALGEELRDRLA